MGDRGSAEEDAQHRMPLAVWLIFIDSLTFSGAPSFHHSASDVSRIAKLYGGGGHRAAAGMRANVENVEDMFVQEDRKKTLPEATIIRV